MCPAKTWQGTFNYCTATFGNWRCYTIAIFYCKRILIMDILSYYGEILNIKQIYAAGYKNYSRPVMCSRRCSWFCSSGLSSRESTFWRRVSYSFSSRCIFCSSVCRAVLRAVSPSSFSFSFSAEGSLVSPAFLISLAAASNKMISLSKPRRNFSLSFYALYRS